MPPSGMRRPGASALYTRAIPAPASVGIHAKLPVVLRCVYVAENLGRAKRVRQPVFMPRANSFSACASKPASHAREERIVGNAYLGAHKRDQSGFLWAGDKPGIHAPYGGMRKIQETKKSLTSQKSLLRIRSIW
jgi:hypothetical protein